MYLSKSIDFLLKNAGPVIQYRLRKEILCDITKKEEENLLQKIYQTTYFKLVQSYVKPNGYIGSGMHSYDNWRGVKLHETPLQDAENAARLLSYYAIPKNHPVVANFITAIRNEETLREEFSYIPPEAERFNTRFTGLNSGWALMVVVYTLQAMLGYGDDFDDLKEYQEICLKGFRRILEISSLDEITKKRTVKGKENQRYIEADEYFPYSYTHAMLAYSKSWRTPENIKMLTDSLNHINKIMIPNSDLYVKIKNNYYSRGLAFNRPVKPFKADNIDIILYRRMLTEIAKLGVGKKADVIAESAVNAENAINEDGILKMRFDLPHNKHYSPKNIKYPGAYSDVALEDDYTKKTALDCDLTFWAVQFLYLVNEKIK